MTLSTHLDMSRRRGLVTGLLTAATWAGFPAACAPAPSADGNNQIQADEGVVVTMTEPNGGTQDYDVVPLPRLIGLADLIVSGTIASVEESTYEFRTDEILKGSASGNIRVTQFVPSRFDGPRAAPYATGQRFLLFLETQPEGAEHWKIMGLGGEGEMPLEDGYVYFHGRRLEDLALGEFRVHGTHRRIQRVSVEDFRDAVRGYLRCFRWHPAGGDRVRPEPEQICDDVAVAEYRAAGPMHERLTSWTLRRIPD